MTKSQVFIKTFIVVSVLGFLSSPHAQAIEVEKQQIHIAGYGYDRVRGIIDGKLDIEGVGSHFSIENIYTLSKQAFGPEQKFDVTEIGLIPFISKYINEGFRDYTLIPIFISRTFRHRNIFVHVDSGISKPEDLRGKRVGTPGYGMSANTWIRGFLLDEYGLKAKDLNWIETQKSSDGGKFKSGKYFLPDDFPLTKGPIGVDESELLLSGKCDALITAITPQAYLEGNPNIKRLFSDVTATEKAYYKKTKMFPIMHVIAIRNDAIKANPNLPKEVFKMYAKAKKMAYEDMETTTSLKVTLPWVAQEFKDTQALMGEDFWSYGIEANRKELESVMRYVYEQGLIKRRINFEELFHASTLKLK